MHTTSLAFIFSWLTRLNDIVSNEYLSFFKPTQKQNSVTPRMTQIFHTLPSGLVTVDGCSLLIKKHMALFQYKLTSHYAEALLINSIDVKSSILCLVSSIGFHISCLVLFGIKILIPENIKSFYMIFGLFRTFGVLISTKPSLFPSLLSTFKS